MPAGANGTVSIEDSQFSENLNLDVPVPDGVTYPTPSTTALEKMVESRVMVLYTGGTIGMKKSAEGVYIPEPNHLSKMIENLPILHDKEYANKLMEQKRMPKTDFKFVFPPSDNQRFILYDVNEYDPLLDSSCMDTADWIDIAKDVQARYENYDGFVILHGTDTMAYTASALSFMLENLGKPVILTGAQVPLYELRSDGRDNLLGAIYLAGNYVIPEVTIFFNHKLYRGNRCKKMSTVSYNAFSTPNLEPLVKLGVNVEINWDLVFRSGTTDKFRVHTNMIKEVGLLSLFPGLSAATVKSFLQPPMRGAVLQTFGAGNIPTNRPELLDILREATGRGVLIVNCSQCGQGMVECTYEGCMKLMEMGIVVGSDMTVEAALSKLGYILGKEELSLREQQELIASNLRGELTQPIPTQPKVSLTDSNFIRAVAHGLRSCSQQGRRRISLSNISQQQLESGKLDRGYSESEMQQVAHALYPSLMCAAAKKGDLNLIQDLSGSGGNLDAADYDGRTPLHVAASEGNLDIVEYLLKSGCSIYLRDRFGHSPFVDSIQFEKVDVIKLIRKTGGHLLHYPVEKVGINLCAAAAHNNLKELQAWYLGGADLNTADYMGHTPLHVAVLKGHVESARFLVENGCRTDIPDMYSNTASQLAQTASPEIRALFRRPTDSDTSPTPLRGPGAEASPGPPNH